VTEKRERGYWWVARPDGEEIVYWTGSEVQLFGTDATLREHEIAEWIKYEGTTIKRGGSDWSEHAKVMASTKGHVVEAARTVERFRDLAVANDPRITLPPGCAFMDVEDGLSVVVYAAHGTTTAESRKAMWAWLDKQAGVVRQGAAPPLDESSLPPGYSLHDDHEDPVFQAALMPWGGTWSTDPSVPPKEAWGHLRGLAKPLLDQACAETEAMRRRAERAGQYLTEVVSEHNATVDAASQKAYARVAAILWPPDEREGKTAEDVLARVQVLTGEPLTRLDLKASRDLIMDALARGRGTDRVSSIDDAIACLVRAAQAAVTEGMPVDLAEQAAWLRGQREAHDDVRDIVARENSLEGLRSALEDLVDGEVGDGKPPVVWKQGPTTLWRDGVWESRGWWAEGEGWHASTRPRTDPSGDLWEWCVWCRGEQTSGFTTKSEEEARRRAEEALVVMLPVTRAGAVVDKEPVEYPGPTIRTVEAVVTSVSERVIPPITVDEQDNVWSSR
jgi:hypothetical protein